MRRTSDRSSRNAIPRSLSRRPTHVRPAELSAAAELAGGAHAPLWQPHVLHGQPDQRYRRRFGHRRHDRLSLRRPALGHHAGQLERELGRQRDRFRSGRLRHPADHRAIEHAGAVRIRRPGGDPGTRFRPADGQRRECRGCVPGRWRGHGLRVRPDDLWRQRRQRWGDRQQRHPHARLVSWWRKRRMQFRLNPCRSMPGKPALCQNQSSRVRQRVWSGCFAAAGISGSNVPRTSSGR